ncbi:transmembrane protein 247 isoform X2 [Larus michahellis]|uniref:transmembrane protein 247 isoform X2 n=1 Tax=Larus michahellis TaxID=119627 RepID=UPI003D9BA0E1
MGLKQLEIQEDLEEISNLKGSEYSFQTTMEELEENQKDNQLTLQELQNNNNKKQLHEKMQGAIRDMTTSSFISDSKTESMDAKCHMAYLDMNGGTSALPSEVSTNAEELEQLCGKQVTAADIELERMRWDFVLAKLKYEHEDNEKQRLHEERMEQIHQQAVKRPAEKRRRGERKIWPEDRPLEMSPSAAKLSGSKAPRRSAAKRISETLGCHRASWRCRDAGHHAV